MSNPRYPYAVIRKDGPNLTYTGFKHRTAISKWVWKNNIKDEMLIISTTRRPGGHQFDPSFVLNVEGDMKNYYALVIYGNLKYGFVNKVVPLDQLIVEAEKIAKVIMEGSPLAIRAIKQMANDGLEMTFRDANSTSFPLYKKFSRSQDFIEGPKAFSEKRKPKWKRV